MNMVVLPSRERRQWRKIMNIDFKEAFARQQPPSTKELAEVKERLIEEYDALSKREKIITLLYWVAASASWVSVYVFMYYGNTLLKTTMFFCYPASLGINHDKIIKNKYATARISYNAS